MVEILLSTYNGEAYLEELLDSLMAQTYQDWSLTIRDDGSTDSTIDIISEYQHKYGEKITLMDGRKNIGTIKSFELLLQQSIAEYVMLCDQDDVWMPDKIMLSLQRMKEEENGDKSIARLVFTDLCVTDEHLNTVNPSYLKQNRIRLDLNMRFNYICVANCAAGCTMMLNRAAVHTVLPFPDTIPIHDWWIAAMVAKHGKLTCINHATILYRQHGNNQYGSHDTTHKFYIGRIMHLNSVIREYGRLKPFLRDVGFGNMGKFWFYKVVYFIRRRIKHQ